MPDPQEPKPEKDIQAALSTASELSANTTTGNLPSGGPLSDTLAQSPSCPLLGLRYGLAKCGLMAEKAPWQTLAALALTMGCTWLCGYFGLTVLACLILYAVYADD